PGEQGDRAPRRDERGRGADLVVAEEPRRDRPEEEPEQRGDQRARRQEQGIADEAVREERDRPPPARECGAQAHGAPPPSARATAIGMTAVAGRRLVMTSAGATPHAAWLGSGRSRTDRRRRSFPPHAY